jgi:hypothetical protein
MGLPKNTLKEAGELLGFSPDAGNENFFPPDRLYNEAIIRWIASFILHEASTAISIACDGHIEPIAFSVQAQR